MYTADTISKYIICRSKDYYNKPINALKLQKILYFVQAEFLINKGRPCFKEDFEAWPSGPVIPSVYEKYIRFGNAGIPIEDKDNFHILEIDVKTIDRIIENILNCSYTELYREVCHQGPWLEAYAKGNRTIISKESIEEYFQE